MALRRKDPELKQIESVREKERKIKILKQQMQQENNAEGLEVVGYMLEELKNKESFVLSQQEVGYFNEVLGKNFPVGEVITF
jgi:transcriptional regulatory protein LevR